MKKKKEKERKRKKKAACPRVRALGIANGVDDNRIADEKRFFPPRIRKLNQLSAPSYLGNEESWCYNVSTLELYFPGLRGLG